MENLELFNNEEIICNNSPETASIIKKITFGLFFLVFLEKLSGGMVSSLGNDFLTLFYTKPEALAIIAPKPITTQILFDILNNIQMPHDILNTLYKHVWTKVNSGECYLDEQIKLEIKKVFMEAMKKVNSDLVTDEVVIRLLDMLAPANIDDTETIFISTDQ